jgi:hypothetical protein
MKREKKPRKNKDKRVDEILKEFIKRSKELQIQEEEFRVKVLRNYNR